MATTIYCEACHFEWELKESDIESVDLDEKSGTRMRYFQCPECSKEYIVDVTNRDLRKDISVYKRMQRKYRRLYDSHASETRLRNYIEKLQSMKCRISAKQTQLRKEWTDGK